MYVYVNLCLLHCTYVCVREFMRVGLHVCMRTQVYARCIACRYAYVNLCALHCVQVCVREFMRVCMSLYKYLQITSTE
jgi:hypothetical protein